MTIGLEFDFLILLLDKVLLEFFVLGGCLVDVVFNNLEFALLGFELSVETVLDFL